MSAPTIEAPAASAPDVGTLEHVDPRTLLLERNIREAKPSKGLVESVRAMGVLQAITAVTSPAGLVVRFGQRRTLAAIEADRATVPVYVVGPDDLANEAEIQRVIGQYDENTQREGLTASDQVGVVEQLVAFGLSAGEITQQARVAREGVDLAIRVSGSKLARKAAAKYEALTLDQAAAVAEFENDPELAKQLIVTAIERPGQFDHMVQRTRDDQARAAKRQKALDKLTAKGVTVIAEPPWGGKIQRLDNLLDHAGKTLTVKAHSTCGGHVAWLNGPGDAVYGCTNPTLNGHKDRHPSGSIGTGKAAAADMSPDEREQAKKARKLVIENNKAWDSAQTVRRAWLADLAKRKTAPKGAAAYISRVIHTEPNVLSGWDNGGRKLALEWLGAKTDMADLADAASEGRALLIALVQVLAAVENVRDRQDWRQNGKSSSAGRYLRYLESIGYGLSDVEKYAVSNKTGN